MSLILSANFLLLLLPILSCLIWMYLLIFRGRFWLVDQTITLEEENWKKYPTLTIIIPARNESEALPVSLPSILEQNYSGTVEVVIVDDQSEDGTEEIAKEIGSRYHNERKLTVIPGQGLPQGWSGKLWAIAQGISYTEQQEILPDYYLLTDADIKHDRYNLSNLVIKAEKEHLALVSLMVLLRCQSFWEKFLIPAFVFFFAKLYPFPLVNNPKSKIAAAAGGCILIRRDVLEKIGGIARIKDALIDDCSLAQVVKAEGENIWLGLTETTFSLRPYPDLKTIWDMVARTAFTQLNYSLLLLLGAALGMTVVYLMPIISLILGIFLGQKLLIILGFIVWLLMSIAYLPTVKFYRISVFWAFSLPAIAFLYTLMTIDSALRHWQGKGGAWKGRVY